MVFSRHDHATLVLAQPPRDSWLALWRDDGSAINDSLHPLELTSITDGVVGTRKVHCRQIPIDQALDALIELPASREVTPSVQAWAAAARIAVDLVSRGLIRPGVSERGLDVWNVGPLSAGDDELRNQLADALPAEAFAVPTPGDDSRISVRPPDQVIDGFNAAVADILPRTEAASKVTGHVPFASRAATKMDPPTAAWLNSLNPRRSDAVLLLRVTVPETDGGRFLASLIIRSRTDAAFEIPAEDFWPTPMDFASHVGEDASDGVLLALRRGAAAWAPLDRLLDQEQPHTLALTESDLRDLLTTAPTALSQAGISLDWPRSEIAELQLIPLVSTVAGSAEDMRGAGAGPLSLQSMAELRWGAAIDGVDLTEEELATLFASAEPLVQLRDRWVRVDEGRLDQLREERSLDGSEALAIALGGASTPGGEFIAARVTGPIAQLVARLASLDDAEPPEPAGFVGELRDYQERGLTWLAEMTDLQLGGVLADDMGLGKTIQVLALHLARADQLGPTLVVCPATLIANWEREAARFAPEVPVRRYHGAERSLSDLEQNEIVIITYGLLRRESDLLAETQWGLVVADEAQAVKNPQSRTARELRTISSHARFALTGTPVENHLTDLWALLDWTTPGLLGPQARFRREVALPIERNRDQVKADTFARLVAPFVLRRRKTDPDIAPELPPKTETDHYVSLTTEQAALYRATTKAVMADVEEATGITRRGLVLKLITELKQVCNHPAQFLREDGPLRRRSGKLDAVDELLDVIMEQDDRALIFSQYVEMGTRLERHLGERGVRTEFLHGSVPVAKRQAMVDRFQEGDVDVFILSLRAGGTGLNLTAATHVIHYDRWWNPAVEDQASDRAWRIGQNKPVQIHRMICEGTLEERIAEVISQKRELAESVVGGSEAWISELSNEDLTELVTLTMQDEL